MSWAVLDELDFDVVGSDQSVASSALEQVARVVARGDVTTLSDDELLMSVGHIERARRAGDAAEAHVLAELESRGLTDQRRGLRTGEWIACETREPIPAAKRRVSIAHRLRTEFPVVDQALTEGRIGWPHATTLLEASNERIAVEFRSKVPYLLGLAEELAFEPWRQEVQRVARRLDLDGGYDPAEDPETTKAFLDRSGDLALLKAVFVGATAAEICHIVETRMDRLWRRYHQDHQTSNGAIKIPPRATIRGEAILELFRLGHAADPATTKAPVTDLTLVLRLGADELFPGGLYPGGEFPGGVSPSDLFAEGRYARNRFFETGDGCDLCGATLEDRLCDAAVTVLLTTDGVPLKLGRTVRFASEGQRRAARVRDGGCVFPGCDCPANWCDLHHVEEWISGGHTNISHLALLCRFHHGVTHRKGWAMFATEDQWFYWTTPYGDTLHSQRNQQQRAGPINAP